jgi:hypothetical protein
MSRHTQSALEKRMLDLLRYHRRFFVFAPLGDDEDSQTVRLVLEQWDRDLVSVFSSTADYPLRGNPGFKAAQRQRKAQAHRDLRAYQQQQLRDGYNEEQSWLRTGTKARTEHPEFYARTEGYDWRQLRRIWQRSPR